MLLLILSVIYIAWFSCRIAVKFGPALRAIPEGGNIPAVRVSLAFLGGVAVYTAAWAWVFSELIEVLYV